MKLSTKHTNQQQIVRADFSGGLNTSSTTDSIAENQLANAVNVEIDSATGRLKTVAGTIDLLAFPNIFAAVYDEINRKLLLVTGDKKIYAADLVEGEISDELGELSGDLYPTSTRWEDGVLIAAGGKLQYFNGTELRTIDSPTAVNVYVRAGRVVIADDGNTLHYSGVGDEENWTEDTNDDSSAKFLEVGYKDGGKILSMINLSSDVLIAKDNRMLYRVSGEFPNWTLSEISRNVEARSRLGICAIADSVFVIGRNEMQTIQTTNAYGDMKPADVSSLIKAEVQTLPANAMLRYLPPLNQIWAIAGETVLMFDLVTRSWFKRLFNSPVLDAIPVGNEVLIIKSDRVSKLDEWSFSDAGEPLHWFWQARRLLSYNAYFLKRVQVSFTPMDRKLSAGKIRVGDVTVELPPMDSGSKRLRYLSSKGDPIYHNTELAHFNPKPVFNRPAILVESRNVYRDKFLDLVGSGSAGGMTFNEIIMTVVEV